jgi:cytochrome c biogenesis protein ResB
MKTLSPEEKEDMLMNKKGAMNSIIGDTVGWFLLLALLVGALIRAFLSYIF